MFAIAAVLMSGLTSCGVTNHRISNYNVAQTQLVLSKDNFRVMGDVESKRAVRENAIADMYRNASLTGAQAVNNITTTVKVRSYLFVVEYEFIASGQIIEFTEE